MNTNVNLVRATLLVLGCLPMIALYYLLSCGVFLFALPATFLGNPLSVVFVVWWLLGTYALLALVYSCATYRSENRPLRRWQDVGLIIGVIVGLPLVMPRFALGLGILGAVLGATAAIFVLVTGRRPSASDPQNETDRT